MAKWLEKTSGINFSEADKKTLRNEFMNAINLDSQLDATFAAENVINVQQ